MLIVFHLKNEIFKATATKEKKIKKKKKKNQKHQNKTSAFRFRWESPSFETQIYKTRKASGFGAGLR